MCLLFLYINPDAKTGEYKVVLVNNRDESYGRPTKPAHQWPSKIYAGMDVQQEREGGTWLGISETGNIGCLLNVLCPVADFTKDGAPRGPIVVKFLETERSGPEYIEGLKNLETVYNPFNLLTMDWGEHGYNVSYYNNQEKITRKIKSGVSGFGNSPIKKPFKKVQKGEAKLKAIIEAYGRTEYEEQLLNELFTMMQDSCKNLPDEQLKEQGRGYTEDLITCLSSIWVTCSSESYGTRTTTAILVDHADRVVYKERTMVDPINLDNIEWKVTKYNFLLKKGVEA